jgi:hypothetical protein
VGGRIRILLCLAVGALPLLAVGALPLLAGGALALLVASPAQAQGGGTTTSAGDQQYLDPLSGSTSATPAPKPSSPTTTTAAPPPTSAPSTPSTPAPAATTATQTPTPASPPSAAANTLPYTGLNLGLVIALGLGLLGGGLILLRLARRA